MVNQDDCITEVVGYQKPGVPKYTSDGNIYDEYDEYDEEVGDVDNILPRIAGIHVNGYDDDLESIGRAIVSSNCLRRLGVWWDDEDEELLRKSEQQSFLERLADNRSIEYLELGIGIDLDMEALAPFLEHNTNLR